MSLKRSEATHLMCPFQKYHPQRSMLHPEITLKCIADECMAWGWEMQHNKVEITERPIMTHEGEPIRPNWVPDSWRFEFADDDTDGISSWIEPDSEAIEHWRGRCRLIPKGKQL